MATRCTYHDRSHKSERGERETVAVSTCIGRMGQHVLPKSFQRVRYDGVQAPRTCATIKPMRHEAWAQVRHVIQGAIKIMAALPSRQRYQRSTGRDPLALSALSQRQGGLAPLAPALWGHP